MKKVVIFLLFPLITSGQEGRLPFRLAGTIRSTRPVEKMFITYQNGNTTVTDSFPVIKGSFTYTGKIMEPSVATLGARFRSKTGGAVTENTEIFLEPVTLRAVIRDSLKNLTLTGSRGHADFKIVAGFPKQFEQSTAPLFPLYAAAKERNDTVEMTRIETEYNALRTQLHQNYVNFIRQRPQSPAAFHALKQITGTAMDPKEIEPLFNLMPPAIHEWPSVKLFKYELAIAKKTMVGSLAMEFVQQDTAGVPVALSSFRGKYVLVDFWASWCGPCRRENPNVVKAFHKFRDKNFTVLGVSLDNHDGRDRWLKAIRDDSLTWTHVSDLKYWDNAVARLYGIRGIPQNILVDPSGRIIAKNLRGEALERKLTEILGKQ